MFLTTFFESLETAISRHVPHKVIFRRETRTSALVQDGERTVPLRLTQHLHVAHTCPPVEPGFLHVTLQALTDLRHGVKENFHTPCSHTWWAFQISVQLLSPRLACFQYHKLPTLLIPLVLSHLKTKISHLEASAYLCLQGNGSFYDHRWWPHPG